MHTNFEEIVPAIQSGNLNPTPFLNWLYKEHTDMVVGYVVNNQGTEEEGRELLHEGVVRIYEQIYSEKISSLENPRSYLMSICRNIWVNRKKREGRMLNMTIIGTELEPSTVHTPMDFLSIEENQEMTRLLLSQLGKNCKQLLIWSDGEGHPMKWIAKELGYANSQVAMNAKSKCRKRLLNLIRNDPDYVKLLDEIL